MLNYCKTGILIVFLCLLNIESFAGTNDRKEFKDLSSKELKVFEEQANLARQHFYSQNYPAAIQLYETILNNFTVDSPLYLVELSICYWALGDKNKARQVFLQAESMLRGFYNKDLEQEAASWWGSESAKVYKGDPYERASLYLFLGLLLLDNGDYDNALASFKSGLLADSDVKAQLYGSDFILLQMLEAHTYRLRGQMDLFKQSMQAAIQAYKNSKSEVLSILETQAAIRKDLKEGITEEVSAAENIKFLAELEVDLNRAMGEVDITLLAPMQKEFNTLLLLWTGRAPYKSRYGDYGEERAIVKFDNENIVNRYEIQIDQNQWVDGITNLADITYQATTRGGREMDDVLASQAEFKSMAHSFAKQAIDMGGDAQDARVALVFFAVGLIAQGISSATSVKSDIRTWLLLPNELIVVPLNLKVGPHQLTIDYYDTLFKVNHFEINTIISKNPMNIILAIPPKKENP